jgi:hypothetical protein
MACCSAASGGIITVCRPGGRTRRTRHVCGPVCHARGRTAHSSTTMAGDPQCHETWGIPSCVLSVRSHRRPRPGDGGCCY